MAVYTETDTLFGELTVQINQEDGLVVVSGSEIPTAALLRRDGATPDPHAPIRSRDATHLDLDVAGVASEVLPARGGLTRRSYRVDVQHDGASYRLVPSTRDKSTLLRNGTKLGRLWAVTDGGVLADWKPGAHVDPQDAAIGYLLAASFGTGAQHVVVSIVLGFLHT